MYVFSEELPLNPPSGGVATSSQQETNVCLTSTQVHARLSVRIALQQRTKTQRTVDHILLVKTEHASVNHNTSYLEQRQYSVLINTASDITFSPMLSTWVLLRK